MVYATEAELEAVMMMSTTFFGASTPITTTMVTAILTQYSALLDGLAGRSEGHFGTDTTCDEWVKQAVLAAAAARIEAKINDKEFTTQQAIDIIKRFMNLRDSSLKPRFHQKQPSTVRSTDGTWYDRI